MTHHKESLEFRVAKLEDLAEIVDMLINDDLGSQRESTNDMQPYKNAFKLINTDKNQHLMVLTKNKTIVGTCHLTEMPSLTYTGSKRLNIEAVRIHQSFRGQGLGKWMINRAVDIGREKNCNIIQLAMNVKRNSTIKFYESMGFEASHVGLKMNI